MERYDYFQTTGGGCRRVACQGDKVREFPFTTNLIMKCAQPGPHPHPGTKCSELLAIKPDMSDPVELAEDCDPEFSEVHFEEPGVNDSGFRSAGAV